MAYTLPAIEQLKHDWSQLEQRFQDFHSYRDLEGPWNELLRRDTPVNLQPELRSLQEGIQFASPDLEKATFDHKAVLKMNPTVIDFRVPGLSQQARDTERDLALFFRRGWDLQNPHRVWDDRVAEGQVRHGLKFERKCYKPFELPEDGKELKYPFYWDNCLLDGFYWPGGVIDPEGPVWYRYSVPVVESGIKKDKQKLSLDKDNKVNWIGEHEPYDYEGLGQKKVQVIVRDYPALGDEDCPLDGCDHKQRYVTTYVCPDGEKLDEAEMVETVRSPFPGSSFFAIGGLVMHTERDPHLVYRPLLLPLYELIQWKNYLVTLLAVLVRNEAKDDSYVNVGGTNPDTIAAAQQAGLIAEGGFTGTMDKQTPGEGQRAVELGVVQRYPKITSEHLVFLIQQCDKMIEEYKPNRYLSGTAYTETSNATGTAFTLAMQAAGLTYEPLLAESDGAIEKSIRYEAHAMRYWDYYCPENVHPKWMVSVTGEEQVMRGKGRAGEQVYVDAKKLAVDFDLVITTGNLTWAEKQAKWSLAKDKYMTGVLTVEDLIREAGIYDVELQKELLFAQRVEQSLEPLEMRMAQMVLTRRAAIRTQYDFGALLGAQPAGPPSVPGGPPVEGAQPQQGAQSRAPDNPNPYAAAVAHSNNPSVSLPPVGQPTGGSSPTAMP